MAQSAKIGALTDELICSITHFSASTNAQAFRHAKEIASKGLRAHHFARTNQFDIQAALDGLDEKFRVLNRDGLADALQERLIELPKISTKWTPEYLSLLLLLSDRPVEHAKLEDLNALQPPTFPPPLTWAGIIADDPLDEEGIWDDIDYAAESSEEEKTYQKKVKKDSVDATPPSSVDEDVMVDPESLVLPVYEDILEDIETAQFWRAGLQPDAKLTEITEIQAIKETLFMLAGLSTSLFTIDRHAQKINIMKGYSLSHAISQTFHSVLSQCADIGSELHKLRRWSSTASSVPLIQTFEASVKGRLMDFDRYLATLQQRYLVPDRPIAVSLLELHEEVRMRSIPILQLATLVTKVKPSLVSNPFMHLEALYERICMAQMAGEQHVFECLARVFFECLQTYLRPIRRWMVEGELGLTDDTFFIFETDKSSEAASIWHDRFALRLNAQDSLHCPSFLQPAALKIFNTGKSVIFLKELGTHQTDISRGSMEPKLDFDTVCGNHDGLSLSPFAEQFDAAFESWIRSKYSLASTILRQHLYSECGLWRVLGAFERVFLAADGSLFQDFADVMFDRMDTRQLNWNDRFLLTELAHGIFAPSLGPDAEKIVIRSSTLKQKGRSVKNLAAVSVDFTVPWSIMNIIQRTSIQVYQRAFVFLLQTYRTKYLLQRIDWNYAIAPKGQSLTQSSYRIRYRLIWLADILRSYLTETVFAPLTTGMTSQLEKAEDIDVMASIHTKYVEKLQDQCLLSKNLAPIHSAIISLLDLAVLFADIHSPSIPHKVKSPSARKAPASSKKSRPKQNRRRSIMPVIELDASSDDDMEDDYDADNESLHDGETSFDENLTRIQDQFERLVPFVVAGLRSVSRAGGEACWELLADRLEWDRAAGIPGVG